MPVNSDNATGYQRPPKHTQFKKGQSGNPRGRPKHKSSFATDLDAVLREKLVMIENGREIRVTKQKAIIRTLTDAAIKKDIRAVGALLACIRLFGVGEEAPRSATQNIEPTDLAI